tara:strand:+ start:389 stop:811 length:423 start_codon:yes stop_codon:yes gene_type:complete
MNLFERDSKEVMISYAKTFVGTPYIWGGSGAGGFDCSGFVQEILGSVGLDPVGDQTAQTLFNFFNRKARGSGIAKGSLLFWGRNTRKITHVSLAINYHFHIEAGGGGSKTKTPEDARRVGAMVRIRPITSRNDLISAIKI